jgi:CDP-diacylglycerol---serine O-phosphatidyltransferase
MFNLPNLFTAGNLMAGIASIICALNGYLDYAVYAIFLGAFFDFCDGLAARILKVSGEMGKQLDSLADMVTFGVAPGIFMMVVLIGLTQSIEFGSHEFIALSVDHWLNLLLDGKSVSLIPLIALVIPFLSVFRLAKFNLDKRQTESFIGVPTPAVTLFFTSFPLVLVLSETGDIYTDSIYSIVFNPIFLSVLIVAMSILLISEIPLFSLKFKKLGWKKNQLRYVFLLISLIFILLFTAWALALIVFLYLILSLIENYVLKTKKA